MMADDECAPKMANPRNLSQVTDSWVSHGATTFLSVTKVLNACFLVRVTPLEPTENQIKANRKLPNATSMHS